MFVDCGGYIGDTTECFIKEFRHYKQVYAYEPSLDNASACQNCLSKYHNITIRQCGVGEKRDSLAIDSSGASSTFMEHRSAKTEEDSESVPIVSFDDDISAIPAGLLPQKDLKKQMPAEKVKCIVSPAHNEGWFYF